MKTQEEIEQLANAKYKDNLHNPFFTAAPMGFIKGYTQCQEDMADKKYTEEDVIKAIKLARETESIRRGALSGDWDDVEKYDEMDIIYLLNKQD
jgi:hypothetical protein